MQRRLRLSPAPLLNAATQVQVQLHQQGGGCYETAFLPTTVQTNVGGIKGKVKVRY